MKAIKPILTSILFILLLLDLEARGNDTLKFNLSLDYYIDLSDTYNGGAMLGGEINVKKSWYGASLFYGHFQSLGKSNLQIQIDGIDRAISIPIEEVSIMQSLSASLFIEPIKINRMTIDFSFGYVYSSAQINQLTNCSYSYDITQGKFIYLNKEYTLLKKEHLGFQFGANVEFLIFRSFSLGLKTRIQDLTQGGTFFFIGTSISLTY